MASENPLMSVTNKEIITDIKILVLYKHIEKLSKTTKEHFSTNKI
jgi:hypothetical protein